MALTIRKKLAPADYVLDSERDQAAPATFHLRPLTDLELMDVWPEMKRDDKGGLRLTGEASRRVLALGVTGWANVRNEEGKPEPFTLEALLALPTAAVIDLASEIINRSTLTEAERKNSESQST